MKRAFWGLALAIELFLSPNLLAFDLASDKSETVIHKNYPKKFKVEITPSATFFLNQVYIDTFFVGGQVSFFPLESFGIHLEGAYGFNSDQASRSCLETFYNDINQSLGQIKCGYQYLASQGIYETSSDKARSAMGSFLKGKTAAGFGPAYVPIREINLLAALTFSWNFVYGKQLAFMSFTNYFDLYLKFGGGISLSNYYPAQLYLKDGSGKSYRTDRVVIEGGAVKDCPLEYGVCSEGPNANPEWKNLIGVPGRPQAIREVSPMATLALGYRFHFLNYFHLLTEVRSYFLVGTSKNRNVKSETDSTSLYLKQFEHYLTITAGLGFRI